MYTVSVRAHELSENKEIIRYEPLLSMVANYFSHFGTHSRALAQTVQLTMKAFLF